MDTPSGRGVGSEARGFLFKTNLFSAKVSLIFSTHTPNFKQGIKKGRRYVRHPFSYNFCFYIQQNYNDLFKLHLQLLQYKFYASKLVCYLHSSHVDGKYVVFFKYTNLPARHPCQHTGIIPLTTFSHNCTIYIWHTNKC